MLLQAALGLSLMHTKGPVDETAAAWTRALELAESLDYTEYRLRAIYGLWLYRLMIGEYRIALALVHMFRSRAENKGDSAELLTGLGMTGGSLHYLGDQTNARAHIERMLDRSAPSSHRSLAVRFGLDQRVGARVHLALILWLQGFPDQARRVALVGVDEARTIDHVASICFALANGACPLGIWVGDLAGTEQLVAMLTDCAERHALGVWHAYGLALSGWVSARRGDTTEGVRLLKAGLHAIRKTRFAQRLTMYLGGLAEALGKAGQVDDGLATIAEALQRSEHNDERWNFAELLRIKGELMLLQNRPGSVGAEYHFLQALERAHRQGALSWELRTAVSLATLWRNQGRTADAFELLAPVYDRFSEGFETVDLKAAGILIRELR
jgi:predicted ATPase